MQKIPKIIHQIWLGKQNPMPIEWMDTFKKIYPDWQYMLWTEDNLPELFNKEILDKETRNHTKCNLIRYEVIYKYGGLHFDADMIALKPLTEEMLDHEFITAYESEKWVYGLIPSAFFVAIPEHPILKDLIENMKNQDQSKASWKFNGTQYFTDAIKKYKGEKVIYPSSLFHPMHFRDKEKRDTPEIQNRIKNAYIDHLWGTTTRKWQADKR